MNKETTASSPDVKSLMAKLDAFFTEYLGKKAPAIPENIKEAIVKYGPYLVVIGLILSIGPIIAFFGISTLVAPVVALSGVRYGAGYYLSTLVLLASLVIEAIAIPGLFGRKKSGWNLMYLSALINAVYAIVNLNVFGLIIGTGITMYILFQIRSYYQN